MWALSLLSSISKIHYDNPRTRITFLSFKCLPAVFKSCFHHFSPPIHKYIDTVSNGQPGAPKSLAFSKEVSFCSPSNFSGLLWYSSKSGRHWSRAYRKRVNKRVRLASKPKLNEAQFDKVVSQLPARFIADDLHDVIALEDDPLVCLELFKWATKQHRFKHNVATFHVTIQKLGIAGMTEDMYEIVDQVLSLPNFGSEVLYNTIIYYLTKARKLTRAITVFKHMKKSQNDERRPSIKTYNILFSAFLARGRNTYINHVFMGTMECLFRQMINDRIEPDILSLNSMIHGYVLSNHVNDALRIYHQMGVVYATLPDSLTYDNLIHGLCAQSRTNNARELFNLMKKKGFVASAKTYNSLVNALAIGGEIDEGLEYLWEMTGKKKCADFITYKTLLDEFCRNGRATDAVNLAKEFRDSHLVDERTYKKLLNALKDDFTVGKIDSVCKHKNC